MTDREAALTDLLLRLSCRPGLIDQWEHIKSEHERPSDTMREGKALAPSLRGKTLEGGSGVAVAFIEGECVALGLIRMWGHVGETREGREKDEEVLSGERVGLKAMCVRGMRGRRRWFGRNKGPQTTLGFLGSLNHSGARVGPMSVRPRGALTQQSFSVHPPADVNPSPERPCVAWNGLMTGCRKRAS